MLNNVTSCIRQFVVLALTFSNFLSLKLTTCTTCLSASMSKIKFNRFGIGCLVQSVVGITKIFIGVNLFNFKDFWYFIFQYDEHAACGTKYILDYIIVRINYLHIFKLCFFHHFTAHTAISVFCKDHIQI